MTKINFDYLSTSRGTIKVVQIIAGFIMCSLLCVKWYGGTSCFGEGRLGYASGLSFLVLVFNLIILVVNHVYPAVWKLERIYSIICSVLHGIGVCLLVWYMIQRQNYSFSPLTATILLFVQTVLFFILIFKKYRVPEAPLGKDDIEAQIKEAVSGVKDDIEAKIKVAVENVLSELKANGEAEDDKH